VSHNNNNNNDDDDDDDDSPVSRAVITLVRLSSGLCHPRLCAIQHVREPTR